MKFLLLYVLVIFIPLSCESCISDYDKALDIIHKHGKSKSLECICEDLRANKEIVDTAVNQNQEALRYSSNCLYTDGIIICLFKLLERFATFILINFLKLVA